MDLKIKNRWVKALRSGKYKQTKNILNGQGNFCCLGVLCDISGQGEWTNNTNNMAGEYSGYLPHGIEVGSLASLPYEVRDWAKMKSCNGKFEKYKWQIPGKENTFCSLDLINDNGASFEDIANIIEKHWREL